MVAQTKTTKDYVVKDKDTLWDIAGKKMSKVQQIKKLNGLKSDTIRPGQKLKLPV
jgi:LysM repeat protein